MEIKILKEEKTLLEIEISNLTIAEILRVYSNSEGADMAAWKRERPGSPAILHIEGANPKKILKSAIAKLEKDIDKITENFKKLK
jgi:DNA-directed RNA polymerase subunit L